jgi:hypothetical protein
MTKKSYTVVKTVKFEGVELGVGEDVALEPGQADALLGTFVEEKVAAPSKAASAATKGDKGKDGL